MWTRSFRVEILKYNVYAKCVIRSCVRTFVSGVVVNISVSYPWDYLQVVTPYVYIYQYKGLIFGMREDSRYIWLCCKDLPVRSLLWLVLRIFDTTGNSVVKQSLYINVLINCYALFYVSILTSDFENFYRYMGECWVTIIQLVYYPLCQSVVFTISTDNFIL